MLAPTDRDQLARACAAIGNQVADDDGFVSVRNLLSLFRARLYVRPLLVEGMLARTGRPGEASAEEWAVLIDSETYPVDSVEVENESSTKPLLPRFRNTV